MSGHSKWHNIQKTKGAQDAKRAAAFTKIAKELIVAVKEGGGITDPANNSRLATVITKAKAANMPNDNIKRCLEKASGAGGGEVHLPEGILLIQPGQLRLTHRTQRCPGIFQNSLAEGTFWGKNQIQRPCKKLHCFRSSSVMGPCSFSNSRMQFLMS